MTQEFIKAHCIGCNYCIYTDGKPWGCGEINDDGCRSEELRLVKQCRLGHKPIPHTPRFNAGDRLEGIPNPIRILAVVTGINGHYITQMEGGHGKFNDTPYPEESIDLEEIDYNYELVEEDTPVPLRYSEGRLTHILWPGFYVKGGMTVEGYALLKQKEEELKHLFGIKDEEEQQ
jgi:hypothetical protein